jgi:hypothetical protein
MPFDFAARLFDETRLGLRVIVAPTDVAPPWDVLTAGNAK